MGIAGRIKVHHFALDSVGQPGLVEKFARRLLVRRGELDADRARRSRLQELELDRADAAADLEQRPPLDTLRLQVVDDPPRRRVQALAPVALRLCPRAAFAEDPSITLRRAAVAHGQIQPRRRKSQSWINVATTMVKTPMAKAS